MDYMNNKSRCRLKIKKNVLHNKKGIFILLYFFVFKSLRPQKLNIRKLIKSLRAARVLNSLTFFLSMIRINVGTKHFQAFESVGILIPAITQEQKVIERYFYTKKCLYL